MRPLVALFAAAVLLTVPTAASGSVWSSEALTTTRGRGVTRSTQYSGLRWWAEAAAASSHATLLRSASFTMRFRRPASMTPRGSPEPWISHSRSMRGSSAAGTAAR